MADWQVARLIPTSGIGSDTEAEMRATSALLAVASIVREFSSALLTPLGAPSARKAEVEGFIEVALKLSDGTPLRPDGVLRVTFGKRQFTALVEVKTNENRLRADQINLYWEAARQFGFDAVITISNELGVAGQHPTEGLKVRANSKVQVVHYSWTKVLSTAVMCKIHRGVDDPEQSWILGELIRYLESPASGAMAFSDMGPNWVAVRDAARTSTLKKGDSEVKDVANRWDQLIRFVSLRLGSEIGVDVLQVFPKPQQDPKARMAHLVESLCGRGTLDGAIKVPHSIGVIVIEADLKARQLVASVDVPAPTDRGSKARATWLLKQLGDEAPSSLVIETWARNARTGHAVPLSAARDNRDLLDDPEGREVLRYRLILRSELGLARKGGGKSPGFVDTVVDLIDRFYGDVVQGISPWTPRAPQLRSKPDAPTPERTEIVQSRPDVERAMDEAAESAAAEARDPVEADGQPRIDDERTPQRDEAASDFRPSWDSWTV